MAYHVRVYTCFCLCSDINTPSLTSVARVCQPNPPRELPVLYSHRKMFLVEPVESQTMNCPNLSKEFQRNSHKNQWRVLGCIRMSLKVMKKFCRETFCQWGNLN
ncbi:hypothetical protein PO909_016934 [Leuciscus waleckii]